MDQDGVARFAEALVTTTSPAATRAVIPRLQAELDVRFAEAQLLVRELKQGPPVAAPVELRIKGPDVATLDRLGEELRALVAEVPVVTHTRASLGGAAAQLTLDVDETAVDLLSLDLATVAAQLDAALAGVIGGSLIEGSEELAIRVRLDGAARGEVATARDLVLLPPAVDGVGDYPGVPVAAVADLALAPGEPVITRHDGERANTVQGFVPMGVLPEEALAAVRARVGEVGWTLPAGYRLEVGGDADARAETVRNLTASVGLIAAATVATIVLTFRSYRLSLISAAVALLSVGLAVLALAVFRQPFGIQALIGVIGSIGVSLNAAIIVLTGLRDTPGACTGDVDAITGVVLHSSRHIWSTTLTTFGGFLPLILAGGGFWPPFALAIAGGVLLSVVLAFAFAPAMFRLVYARAPRGETPAGVPLTLTRAASTRARSFGATAARRGK
jgi:multidrug efflux pump subunit AcrB